MTMTVSVSELRNNISLYLERVLKGTRVLIRDEKRNFTIAEIYKNVFSSELTVSPLYKAIRSFDATSIPSGARLRKRSNSIPIDALVVGAQLTFILHLLI